MKLSEVKALITGGSVGIGLATARRLTAAGAKIAICGRNEAAVEKAAKEIGAFAVRADVGDESDVRNMVKQVGDEFGGFNTLVNNAGMGKFGPLVDLELAEFQEVMRTNVFGAMLVARESAKHFIERGEGGNIINISSTAGGAGFAGGTAYVASKFALGGMTQCWRAELRKSDIRVMQVNPSEVLTEFAERAGYGQKAANPTKLRGEEIAHAITSVLEMDGRGFTTELTVFATNPQD